MPQRVVVPVKLGVGTRTKMRLKHAWRLSRDVGQYSARQRIWWLIPMVAVVAIVAAVVTTTSTALPYAVYTLF